MSFVPMKLYFSKYHGAGNDFIIIDNRNGQFVAETALIRTICHRQFGIGADGLMLLENEPNVDFCMRYFNSDGNESTMCGNGGRCISMFAKKLGVVNERTRFAGIDGEHIAIIQGDGTVRLKMKDVVGIEQDDDFFILDTGSPHCVKFVDDVSKIDVQSEGRFLRNSFLHESGGVNVNFVQVTPDGLKIRTYERGVEGETLACGTGSVAAAVAANVYFDNALNDFKIYALGGTLNVSFEKYSNHRYTNVWLKGPVTHVFDGSIDIP